MTPQGRPNKKPERKMSEGRGYDIKGIVICMGRDGAGLKGQPRQSRKLPNTSTGATPAEAMCA